MNCKSHGHQQLGMQQNGASASTVLSFPTNSSTHCTWACVLQTGRRHAALLVTSALLISLHHLYWNWFPRWEHSIMGMYA